MVQERREEIALTEHRTKKSSLRRVKIKIKICLSVLVSGGPRGGEEFETGYQQFLVLLAVNLREGEGCLPSPGRPSLKMCHSVRKKTRWEGGCEENH